MKVSLFFIPVLLFFCCNDKSPQPAIEHAQDQDTVMEISAITYTTDTLTINDLQWIEFKTDDRTAFLLSTAGDTIIPLADYYHRTEIIDMNEDGYDDLRTWIISNNPNECDNYLYNAESKSFTYLEDCYSDITHLDGTGLYFDYRGAGCAGSDWESELSRIDGDTLVVIAYLFGLGCEDMGDWRIVEVYSVQEGDDLLVEKIPYDKFIADDQNRFEYIRKYWTNNYRRFQ